MTNEHKPQKGLLSRVCVIRDTLVILGSLAYAKAVT